MSITLLPVVNWSDWMKISRFYECAICSRILDLKSHRHRQVGCVWDVGLEKTTADFLDSPWNQRILKNL